MLAALGPCSTEILHQDCSQAGTPTSCLAAAGQQQLSISQLLQHSSDSSRGTGDKMNMAG